jgi:hypothetical protein
MSKEGILSIFLKRQSKAIPTFEILLFDIRYSAVRCSTMFDGNRNGSDSLKWTLF